jgi:hypothetical protein
MAATIKDLSTRLPRKLDGDLPADDPFHGDLDTIRGVEMTSPDTIAERGRMVLSLWNKYNARLAAQSPPVAALTVGGLTAGDLDAALTALPEKTQAVEDQKAALSDRRSELRTLAATVDTDNKRWFAAWQGEYSTGTPENDALSQIDTGPVTPAPSALEISTATATAATTARLTYTAGGGAHATTLALQWKLPTDAEFGNDTPVVQPHQDVTNPAFAGKLVTFRTVATNSVDSTISAEKTVQF